jgi:hypothetical protein
MKTNILNHSLNFIIEGNEVKGRTTLGVQYLDSDTSKKEENTMENILYLKNKGLDYGSLRETLTPLGEELFQLITEVM